MKRFSLLIRDDVIRKKLMILLTMLVGILAVMVATALTLTSTSTFCGFCHEMKADHAAWSNSDHKNVYMRRVPYAAELRRFFRA